MTGSKRLIALFLTAFAFVALAGLQLNAKASNDNPNTISVTCPETISEGEPIAFTANVNSAEADLPFKWSVSAGRILQGQSTPTIKVPSSGLRDQTVTATLELGGKGCIRIFTCSSHVLPAER